MKLLILGGTRFVGRHLTEAALADGHEVTLFNRGQFDQDIFPDVEKLRGDRDSDLAPLKDRFWDAVIDTCGYVPRVVHLSADLLRNAVDQYVFISSVSVYTPMDALGLTEDAARGVLEDPTVEEITLETYGPLKVLCEQVVQETYPGQALIVRPGIIVGPYDYSDRFTYLAARAARGGEMLVPGPPDAPVQIIDARDLAEWAIRLIEAKTTGVFNAVGDPGALTAFSLIEAVNSETGSDARATFVGDAWLSEQGVSPHSVNAWAPFDEPGWSGAFHVSNRRAVDAGLTLRPIRETIRDTTAWDVARGPETKRKVGLEPERERELLAAWKAR